MPEPAAQPVNLAQTNVKANIRRYLKRKGCSPQFIKQFKEGYCHGLAVLAVYGQYLNCQPNLTQPCDNWDWFNHVLRLLAGWNGHISQLSLQNEKDINRFISLIEFFQNISSYLPYGQGSLDQYLMDTRHRTLKLEYTFAGLLSAKNFTQQVQTGNSNQTTTLINELLKYDQRLILISCGRHTLSLFKQNGKVTLYNSSNPLGLQTFSTEHPHTLINAIYKAYHYHRKLPSPIGFRLFSFAPQPGHYAEPATLLSQLHTPLTFEYPGNRKNYTALHIAARIGSLACADYFLKQGADQEAEDNDGQTARRIALNRRYTDIANLILTYQQPVNHRQFCDQGVRFFTASTDDESKPTMPDCQQEAFRPD